MSFSAEETRRRGLNFARRQIAAGKATKQDLERWEKELGAEVRKIAQEVAPSKATPSAPKSATTKES